MLSLFSIDVNLSMNTYTQDQSKTFENQDKGYMLVSRTITSMKNRIPSIKKP